MKYWLNVVQCDDGDEDVNDESSLMMLMVMLMAMLMLATMMLTPRG